MSLIESLPQQLEISGFAICPNFLKPELIESLKLDLHAKREAQGFHFAGTGHKTSFLNHGDIRKDEIHWLTPDGTPNSELIFKKLEALRQQLNQQLFLGLEELEAHYSIYPPGGFYRRHRDSFRDDHHRMISIVIYLNSDWQVADGGQLRLYTDSITDLDTDPVTDLVPNPNKVVDIEPLAGTLVCFLSREIEHEVLPCSRERLSFTGWFKVRQLV